MLIAIHGVKLYALYFGVKLFLIVTHGVRLYAQSFKWSENLCSLLYMV